MSGDSRAELAQLRLMVDVPAAMRQHAEAVYPEEACGGLLGRPGNGEEVEVVEAAPVTNVREHERRRRYLIGPEDVLHLERRAAAAGLQVVGYYHSHPDAPPLPSAFDREHAWPWYVYLIISVENGRAATARAWQLADDREDFKPVPMINEERHMMIEEA
jgi:proteasome lid subunit RPN8/RPN11